MDAALRQELEAILLANEGNLGKVAQLWLEGKRKNREFVDGGAAANQGAAANIRITVEAILDGVMPRSASVALQAKRSVSALIKQNPEASPAAVGHLVELRDCLEELETDAEAVRNQEVEIEKTTRALEESLEKQPGVYVYTLPSFMMSIKKTDPDRFWFKVGKTDRAAGVRIGEQTRVTGLPEDPYIARVYRHPNLKPVQVESHFHDLLEAAGHSRSDSRHAGRDWFATNLDFLDAIATSLGCEIAQGSADDE